MKKILIALFFFSAATSPTQAQIVGQHIQLSDMLWYVLPFYTLTLAGLSLFLLKLLRPKMNVLPLLIVSLISIVWAVSVTLNFKKIQDEQLGASKIEEHLADKDLSPKARADLKSQQQEQTQYWFGNFYTTAMPNIVLFSLGIILHYRQKNAPADAAPRTRYK
jgi:hypothetical protein